MASGKLFREYIGAEFKDVRLSDVPINRNVDFHFILSFAIDYSADSSTSPPSPTNGQFDFFWDSDNITPDAVAAVKSSHSNVRVALSLGGDSVGDDTKVFFAPSSVDSWVGNAVSSLTDIIQQYHLDGIDIDYEHFDADDGPSTDTFAECIGRLITTLKRNGVISFASIAPFGDTIDYYLALWGKYQNVIDYVNYQFYELRAGATMEDYLDDYNTQSDNFDASKLLASLLTGDPDAISPDTAIDACRTLQSQGKLFGIFIWSADNSKSQGFTYENQAQNILANAGD
ncbi:chitinase 2-like [Typha angustifolia]|uniref:chitinase 2-like n=1 Tax=Typha angustifolia TaxID=59011 RepID=UPI003C2DE044